MAAGCDAARLRRISVHAARFRVLNSIRQDSDVGRAWISSETYLIVSDIEAARAAIIAGIELGEIFHLGPNGPVSGLDPELGTYGTRASFSDPDVVAKTYLRHLE